MNFLHVFKYHKNTFATRLIFARHCLHKKREKREINYKIKYNGENKKKEQNKNEKKRMVDLR